MASSLVRLTLTLIWGTNLLSLLLPGWKARCNLIFRNEDPDFHSISIRAINHVREYFSSSYCQPGKQLILNNYSIADGPFLFVSSLGNCKTGAFGAGFFLSNTNSQIICGGCCNNRADSVLEAEALALTTALGSDLAMNLHVNTIFIANSDLHRLINADIPSHAWRLDALILSIPDSFKFGSSSKSGHPQSQITPNAWMGAAISLALFGVNSHMLTLFHQGKDLSRWLMKHFLKLGFSF